MTQHGPGGPGGPGGHGGNGRQCMCGPGEFCNGDDGPGMGGCEPCHKFREPRDCGNDGLPDFGRMDCEMRCFGNGPPMDHNMGINMGPGGRWMQGGCDGPKLERFTDG